MNNFRNAYLLLNSGLNLLILLLFVLPVHAATGESSMSIQLDASLYHFSYQEFTDSGKLLDAEEGMLPGGSIALQKKYAPWSLRAAVAAYGGYIDYIGQTQLGTPITSITMENIVDSNFLAEYWQETASGKQYAPYAGVGYHYWRRDIHATGNVSGLVEIYTWFYALLGGKAEFYKTSDTSMLLDVRIFRTIHPNISVDFGGSFDNTGFGLGERWGGRVAMPLLIRDFLYGPQTALQIEPYFERFEIGRSEDHPLRQGGTISEPFSRTVNFGINLGIRQSF